jgi:hypothetical protein
MVSAAAGAGAAKTRVASRAEGILAAADGSGGVWGAAAPVFDSAT